MSHAHNDHTADLESIITLLHKYNENLKGLDNFKDDDTIRAKIAEKNKKDIRSVRKGEIEKYFLKNKSGKKIYFYITKSIQKKYPCLFDKKNKNIKIKIIKKENEFNITNNAKLKVINAKHNDIISNDCSCGFILNVKGKNDKVDASIIYTGDTGWSEKIENQYNDINKELNNNYKILIAHLGGFKEKEEKYIMCLKDNKDDYGYCYENHLGRIGLVHLNEILKPDICLISEFGEEFKGSRIKIAKIFQDAFNNEDPNRNGKNKIRFLPADIGLKFSIKDKKIRAITKLNIDKYEISDNNFDYINPWDVEVCELRKDYSLNYYKKNAGFTETDLVQIIHEVCNIN